MSFFDTLSAQTHTFKRLDSLSEMLAFCAGKEIEREHPYAPYSPSNAESCAAIIFTDGTGLVCGVESPGFAGSDVTPPDPSEVVYYAAIPR